MLEQVQKNSLLVEFLTEELPPINLEKNIGKIFASALFEQLSGFTTLESKLHDFVAPRRFGCVIENINFKQQTQQQLRKGPAISNALKDDMPTQALLGFAKSCATDWQQLEAREDGYFYFAAETQGKNLNEVINVAVNNALKKIPIAKGMRWGDSGYQFIRPVHNLVVMYDDQALPVNSFGLNSLKQTLGHRFMGAKAPIQINTASNYFSQIYEEGKVVASFSARRELIRHQLAEKAQEIGLTINPIDGLLEEVTALVEWPEVLLGSFATSFLRVPQECLILSMAKNQKYFALLDSVGRLTNKFLFVANLISKDPQIIIDGNQKVLSARLSDAEFFYEFDKRTPLTEFVQKMATVVYHNKLGSQLDRIVRLQEIAANIAPLLGVDSSLAKHTAYLLKADLATEMVGEFPELQGVMGKYYALTSSESQEVANAIEKHYYPRFSGDGLPDSNLGLVMALSDKLETLLGIWGVGLIPTGDKDPYALRRAALGIIRILLINNLDLKELLSITFVAFSKFSLAKNTVDEVYQFILQRLANYLTSIEKFSTKAVNAVLAVDEFTLATKSRKQFSHLPQLLHVLTAFANDENNQPLFQANKRIENILKKNAAELIVSPIKEELLQAPAEIALFKLFSQLVINIDLSTKLKDPAFWDSYFAVLAKFNQALANFFDEVMVMDKDNNLRQNRLNLLYTLHRYFNILGKLSELA